MLIGGADASGDRRTEGERNYLALLIGTEERIKKIHKDIGIDRIHMSELSESQRQRVHNNLDFNHDDIQVWCFHVQKQHLVEYMLNHPKLIYLKKPKLNIHKNFDRHLLNLFRDDLERFVFARKHEFSDITIQIDADMKDTIQYWRMKREYKGIAHELADAVSWFNQKQIHVDRCEERDFREQLKSLMEHDLLRK